MKKNAGSVKVIRQPEVRGLSRHTQETISELVGEEVIPVVQYLRDKKNVSEFKIAEDTEMEVNRVRSVLYRLHSQNLVVYYRKKDRQKGWYISYWTFNPSGLKHAAAMMRRRKLEQLKERMRREEENRDLFYICPSLCTRMDFDNATDVSFKCPECGKTLTVQENSKTIALLRTKIAELEAEL
ncbi:hypothetical protein HYY74_00280 [Candidatus Woesearchaeota archaeon]|nr:hypothetical protein [Candidatus Woesearchaeota archaeon]